MSSHVLRWGLPLVVLALVACDLDAVREAQRAVSGQPPPPRPCPTCGGTGTVTESVEAPLPFEMAGCDVARTGFLGFGRAREATVGIRNNGDQGGMFSFIIVGNYPGGGEVSLGEVTEWIPPHDSRAKRVPFRAEEGMLNITCTGQSPLVVQQHQRICSTCGGAGTVR
jgi:hypothetical protein